MRCLQLNTNHSARALDVAWRVALDKGIDFLLLTEPNIQTVSAEDWYNDNDGDVVVQNVSG